MSCRMAAVCDMSGRDMSGRPQKANDIDVRTSAGEEAAGRKACAQTNVGLGWFSLRLNRNRAGFLLLFGS